MRQSIFLILLITASLLSFGWYCVSLIDLVEDIKTGVYEHNYLLSLSIIKSLALLVYTYLAIQFIKSKINLFESK